MGGRGGIDDSGGCSKVSRKGKSAGFAPFRVLVSSVGWYCRQVLRGVPGIGCPLYRGQ